MSLAEVLKANTRAGDLFTTEDEGTIRCSACGHRCRMKEGQAGICGVRFVQDGKFMVPSGYVAGLQCDPIEKKPFFHVLPGRDALSFGMLGCNFHCAFCQNWVSSQALGESPSRASFHSVSAGRIARMAAEEGAPIISSTYNEPLITSEWAVDILKRAKHEGIRGAFVSNGHATPEVLEYLRPYVDFFNVDLKSFQESNYRELGGSLKHVLDSIRRLKEMGFWVEVITLLVPGFNDSVEEIARIADFIVSVSPDIPWHITAFHSDYKVSGVPGTTAEQILAALEVGQSHGIRYVYAGNLPGRVSGRENTYCHSCKALLVKRYGYLIRDNRISEGKCPQCETSIPGVWA